MLNRNTFAKKVRFFHDLPWFPWGPRRREMPRVGQWDTFRKITRAAGLRRVVVANHRAIPIICTSEREPRQKTAAGGLAENGEYKKGNKIAG